MFEVRRHIFTESRFNNHNPTEFVLAISVKCLCDTYLIVDVCCLLHVCVLPAECLPDRSLWRECWEASSWNMICRAGMHWGISLFLSLSLCSLCSPGMIERRVRLPLGHWNLFLLLCCLFPIGFVEITLTLTLSSQLFWPSECLWGPRLKRWVLIG